MKASELTKSQRTQVEDAPAWPEPSGRLCSPIDPQHSSYAASPLRLFGDIPRFGINEIPFGIFSNCDDPVIVCELREHNTHRVPPLGGNLGDIGAYHFTTGQHDK